MRIAHLALTASLTFTAPAYAQPVELPKGLVGFTELVMQVVLQTAVSAARSQVELTYDDIVLDLAAGRTAMTGLEIHPALPWDQSGDCVASADAIELFAPAHLDISVGRIEIVGLNLPLSCLPPDPQGMILAAGYESLQAPTLAIDFDYHSGSSALDLTVSGTVTDAVAFEAAVELAYFWVQTTGGLFDEVTANGEIAPPPGGEPVADLEFAEIAISNLGLLERAGPILGAMIGGFEAVPPMIEGAILQELGPDGQTFAVEMRSSVETFLAGDGKLVITVAPDSPLRLTPDLTEDPQVLFAALDPRASGAVAASSALIDRALLDAALSGGDLSDDDRLLVGAALADGVGAPRAPGLARDVLDPLVAAGNPEAALIASESLGYGAKGEAYALALIAAAGGADGGLTRLDRLEADLDFETINEAQEAIGTAADGENDVIAQGDLTAIYNLARDLDRGVGVPRNYAAAYRLAALAAAGGDRGAAALRDRIDARLSRRGAGSEGWAAARDKASEAALDAWLAGGLLDRLAQ